MLDQLASKWHDAYDNATGGVRPGTARTAAAQANQQWTRNPHRHPAAGRMGNHDPTERLADMDADGVDVEVLYSELSGFRYFNKMGSDEGGNAATRAFNDALTAFATCRPRAPRRLLPAAAPRRRRPRSTRCSASQSIGGKSLQLPVFPPEVGRARLLRTNSTTRCGRPSPRPACRSRCHVGLNTALNCLAAARPNAAARDHGVGHALTTAEAFGMWIVTGMLERFPDLKLVFVETQLGWVPWYLHIMDDLATAPALRVPGHQGTAELLLPPQHPPHVHRGSRGWPPTTATTLGVNNLMWSTDYPHPVSIVAQLAADHRRAAQGLARRRAATHPLRQRRACLESLTKERYVTTRQGHRRCRRRQRHRTRHGAGGDEARRQGRGRSTSPTNLGQAVAEETGATFFHLDIRNRQEWEDVLGKVVAESGGHRHSAHLRRGAHPSGQPCRYSTIRCRG